MNSRKNSKWTLTPLPSFSENVQEKPYIKHPVTWIQRKSHRFGQGAHVDWGKIEQDPAGLVLTLKTWALYSVRCPGRRPLCLLCFPQDEPPEYHFPWRFFWSFHMMFSGSKVCPPELHINRTIRHWSEAKAGVLLHHLFFSSSFTASIFTSSKTFFIFFWPTLTLSSSRQ